VLEALRRHLDATIDPPPPPAEYEEFLLCGYFGCLPHELDEIDEAKYRQALAFLRVERASCRLRAAQNALYG